MNMFGHAARASSWLRACLSVVFVAVLAACSAPGEESLVLHTDKGNFTFHVEIAETDKSRERGLMFRTSLGADAGMLFDFHGEAVRTFWMQNTLIPLDMVFVSGDGVVRTVHENARPMDTTTIASEVPVRFVLEIAGGRAAQIGLKPGDRMDEPRVGTPEDK